MVRVGEKRKEQFIRIKIGSCETGHKGFFAPIRNINVSNLSVEEVSDVITKALNKKLGIKKK